MLDGFELSPKLIKNKKKKGNKNRKERDIRPSAMWDIWNCITIAELVLMD